MDSTAVAQYEEKGKSLLEVANSIQITDEETRQHAATFVLEARHIIKSMENEFKPDIKKAHELHADLLSRLKRLSSPFIAAQKVVDTEISRDYFEQERIRKAEEDRVRKEAEEAIRLEQEAITLAEKGNVNDAVEILDKVEEMSSSVPVHVEPIKPLTKTNVGSTTVRKGIRVTCTNKMAVVRAVASGKLPESLIDINDGAAKRHIVNNKLNELTGFSIKEVSTVVGTVR